MLWNRNDGGINAQVGECVVDFLRTTPLSEAGIHDRTVSSVYGGVWAQSSQPGERRLNFAMNNSEGGDYVEMLYPLLFDQADKPVWLYAQHPNGGGEGSVNGAFTHKILYVRSNFLAHQECIHTSAAPCIDHHDLVGQSDNVTRQFTNPTAGQVSIAIGPGDNATFNVEGHALKGWRYPTSPGMAGIEKQILHNAIEVNRYECEVMPDQSTCPVTLSWSAINSNVRVWRRDLVLCPTNTACLQQVGSGSAGSAFQPLSPWASVRYELRSGTQHSGTLLAATPRVRAFGVIPDVEPVVVNLPTHDPAVGSVAGTAGVGGGAAAYEIPIQVAPGRRGMQPNLSLVYSSRSGNGIAGMGWSLSGLSSIHRCPQTRAQDGRNTAVDYSLNDRLCLDGRRLMLETGSYGSMNATYRTEIDDFARVTQLGGSIAPNETAHFKVEHKSGQIDWYGYAPAHNHLSPNEDGGRHMPIGAAGPLSWARVRSEDRNGNFVRYIYRTGAAHVSHGEYLIDRIWYTGHGISHGNRWIDFQYESRNDSSSSYLSGGLTMQRHRLKQIRVSAPTNQAPGATAAIFRTYELAYGNPSNHSRRSLLRSVTECPGNAAQSNPALCKRATTFGWQDAHLNFHLVAAPDLGLPAPTALSLSTNSSRVDVRQWLNELQRELLPPAERNDVDTGLRDLLPTTSRTPPVRAREFEPLGDFDGDGAAEWLASVLVPIPGPRNAFTKELPD